MTESEENPLKIFIEKGTDLSPVDNMKINNQCESVFVNMKYSYSTATDISID